ncbi:biotin/lipoyl-containing protein [Chromatocurvus halotolerans]|uniref:Biotin carboxylase C-terminal domain-containing protein n=1 Tax=Chromatocurvus halotolerans TaxID=1132028 RepID=A0A4R2KWK3_9GAMM|nr:biotin/lipoyl-containing protein [Chromatocurvus halotolerans]TCO78273.1 biotin carboxylase C-terminal domain-containing protein [Chromatocurvus halotolerans]
MSNEHYLHNPLIHADRRLGRARSRWVQQFDCSGISPLIICRGPIRKEAMDVFSEMGISHYGILLSEKDSIVYRNALAPELRSMSDPNRIHRVPDYTGSNKEEREQRIRQIIQIAHDNGYNAVFAGYGFMAEDEAMVAAMEAAGLNFIGPCSRTVHDAGLKDEAKRTALRVGVSVTPGVDNATALTLLKRYPDVASLAALAKEHALEIPQEVFASDMALDDIADRVLAASYARGVDLYTVEELCDTVTDVVAGMAEKYPDNRIRLKAISGGGGKGQRILGIGETARTAELVREILNEVKTTGVGDNKNVLVELNIETTRHQEIQVIGNGDWCISMGGRDCSLQMHEQKLLEVSVTDESLRAAHARAQEEGRTEEARALERDVRILTEMEDEAARFGAAVGLDSVSTFECIVDRDQHFFMEMNTRIQVEHRVTELCYALRFINPEDPDDGFTVNSLVEAMVLLAAHGERLPRPERVLRHNDSVEARLNATNQALQPSAGGVIEFWSDALPGEIRDDQGISLHNPDTDVFMKYTLAGAYDSNIALLLTVGDTRLDVYQRMAESLRRTRMRGKDLATNLEFHYGLVNWFIGQNINARPTTRFIVPYLTAVGELRARAGNIDLSHAWRRTVEHSTKGLDADLAEELRTVMERKQTLLLRPLEVMFSQPHVFSGWLSINRDSYTLIEGRVSWNTNPIALLAELYHYLNMDAGVNAPAARVIWDHDDQILRAAGSFYDTLHERSGVDDWLALQTLLEDEAAPASFDAAEWQSVRAAHRGYQAGSEILALLPAIAEDTHFRALSVNPDLSIAIPDALLDPTHQAQMAKVLVPPPAASADEILAQSGGMFYARETPESEPYVRPGDHFAAGDPLYIIEVMKMFNKVYAPFAGTIDDVLVENDGVIISKGQPLFRITPDERVVMESADDIAARSRRVTDEFLARVL